MLVQYNWVGEINSITNHQWNLHGQRWYVHGWMSPDIQSGKVIREYIAFVHCTCTLYIVHVQCTCVFMDIVQSTLYMYMCIYGHPWNVHGWMSPDIQSRKVIWEYIVHVHVYLRTFMEYPWMMSPDIQCGKVIWEYIVFYGYPWNIHG